MPKETLADLGPRPLTGLENAYRATMAERMRLPPQISSPVTPPTQPMPVRPMPGPQPDMALGGGLQLPGGLSAQGAVAPPMAPTGLSRMPGQPIDWSAMLRYRGGGQ